MRIQSKKLKIEEVSIPIKIVRVQKEVHTTKIGVGRECTRPEEKTIKANGYELDNFARKKIHRRVDSQQSQSPDAQSNDSATVELLTSCIRAQVLYNFRIIKIAQEG